MTKAKIVLLILAIISFILLINLDRNLQRRILYYPVAGLPSDTFLSNHNMQYWPSGANNYRGFIGGSQSARPHGTVIIFHGNAGTAADRAFYVRALTELGYSVILAEYPGYGGRRGNLGEESFVTDAIETLRLASDKYGEPIYLLGESLGCGVVAAVAKESTVKIDGIILITPWDTLLSIAQENFPWLPVRFLLSDKYDSVENLKDYRGDILIVGAERDQIIPLSHAVTLHRLLPNTSRLITIRGAGHNDWPEYVDLKWWKGITALISRE